MSGRPDIIDRIITVIDNNENRIVELTKQVQELQSRVSGLEKEVENLKEGETK